jgi:CheY-like chemotaxis protein
LESVLLADGNRSLNQGVEAMAETFDVLVRMLAVAVNLVWVLILGYLLVYFRHSIRAILDRAARAEKASISVGDKRFEAMFQGVADATANLTAAAAANAQRAQRALGETEVRDIARSVTAAAETGAIGRLRAKRVLWVDDEPENNEYGIRALQSQGAEVVESRSTAEALQEIERSDFDAIITDQLRHEDGRRNDRAGYDLMSALKEKGIKVPVILSTAFPSEEEARSQGFFGATNTQHGVFELVLKAVEEP